MSKIHPTESAKSRSKGGSWSQLELPDREVENCPLNSSSDLERLYVTERILGRGAQGTVRLAVNKRTGIECAVKEVARATGTKHTAMLREVKILTKLSHRNIITLEAVCTSPSRLFLVVEYCPEGTLEEYMSRYGNLTESTALDLVTQLSDALKYLHDYYIIHRDLKADNVLITSIAGRGSDDDKLFAKLSDFGLSIMTGATGTESLVSPGNIVGTPHYMAPEMLRNRSYSCLCDIWSLGVLTYRMLSLEYPFEGETVSELATTIITSRVEFPEEKFPNELSEPCQELISLCLTTDPAQRLTARNILQHRWVTGSTDNNFHLVDPWNLIPSPPNHHPRPGRSPEFHSVTDDEDGRRRSRTSACNFHGSDL